MTSIPGMDEVISKRTQEEEERLAQLEEKEEENRRRIVIAYGEEALKGGAKAHKRRRHVYIFNPEDLDNDEIIASVENSPTYQRDKATLEKIKAKATAVETATIPEMEDGSNIISIN